MKKFILESAVILGVVLTLGLATEAHSKEITVTAGAGMVDKVAVGGIGVKRGKYTIDGHVGMGENKSAVSVGVYRELIKFSDLGIGVGLSANQSKELKGKIETKRTYQGYDLQLDYDFEKVKMRGTINGNGDVKVGIGFSF